MPFIPGQISQDGERNSTSGIATENKLFTDDEPLLAAHKVATEPELMLNGPGRKKKGAGNVTAKVNDQRQETPKIRVIKPARIDFAPYPDVHGPSHQRIVDFISSVRFYERVVPSVVCTLIAAAMMLLKMYTFGDFDEGIWGLLTSGSTAFLTVVGIVYALNCGYIIQEGFARAQVIRSTCGSFCAEMRLMLMQIPEFGFSSPYFLPLSHAKADIFHASRLFIQSFIFECYLDGFGLDPPGSGQSAFAIALGAKHRVSFPQELYDRLESKYRKTPGAGEGGLRDAEGKILEKDELNYDRACSLDDGPANVLRLRRSSITKQPMLPVVGEGVSPEDMDLDERLGKKLSTCYQRYCSDLVGLSYRFEEWSEDKRECKIQTETFRNAVFKILENYEHRSINLPVRMPRGVIFFLSVLAEDMFFGVLLIQAGELWVDLVFCLVVVSMISYMLYVLQDFVQPFHGNFQVDLSSLYRLLVYVDSLEKKEKQIQYQQSK